MDVVSHGLWGSALLGRKDGKLFAAAFVVSLLPDVFAEGVMFTLALAGLPGMPDLSHGHPDITAFPAWAQDFYNTTHSLIVFGLAFVAIWLARRKPPLLLLAWGLHVLIDIPTHSLRLFPTPFLWPVSSLKVDGIAWRSPVILVPNVLLLLVVYGTWAWRRRSGDSTARGTGPCDGRD